MKTTSVVVLVTILAVSVCFNLWQAQQADKPKTVAMFEHDEDLRRGEKQKEAEDEFSCVVGFMVMLDDGRYFESTKSGYYRYDPEKGDIITDEVVQLPIGHRAISLIPLRRWEISQGVNFGHPKGSKGLYVHINMFGIETLYSSRFIGEMIRRYRGSADESWAGYSDDEVLDDWLRNEIEYAVGPDEGRGVPIKEVSRRVNAHFDYLWDKYGLWCSGGKWIWTGVTYQGG